MQQNLEVERGSILRQLAEMFAAGALTGMHAVLCCALLVSSSYGARLCYTALQTRARHKHSTARVLVKARGNAKHDISLRCAVLCCAML